MFTDTVPPYSFASRRMTFKGREYGAGSSILRFRIQPHASLLRVERVQAFDPASEIRAPADHPASNSRHILKSSRPVRRLQSPSIAEFTCSGIHTNLGTALMRQGRFEEGLRHHRKQTEIDPSGALNWYTLAVGYLQCNRLPEALDASRRASEAAPRSTFKWRGITQSSPAVQEHKATMNTQLRRSRLF